MTITTRSEAYADSVSGAYTACGVEPLALETLCPDYLAQACNTCPEHFTCAAAVTRCDDGLYLDTTGCDCRDARARQGRPKVLTHAG